MAFKPEEITRLEQLADEMARLIEDVDTTSSEASVVYGKIGRACARALANVAAVTAKQVGPPHAQAEAGWDTGAECPASRGRSLTFGLIPDQKPRGKSERICRPKSVAESYPRHGILPACTLAFFPDYCLTIPRLNHHH